MSTESREGTASTERHPVDERMPIPSLLLYGLQHVMSMYAGVVAVPLIVGGALGLPFAELAYLLTAALLVSGLATLLQTLGGPRIRIGAGLPIVQARRSRRWRGCSPSAMVRAAAGPG
jgi:uric acid transporter